MEIRVDVKGVSCHGSAPERGDNAIYKMADILQDVRALNENPADGSTEINGLVKMLDPKFNPEHYEDARFLGRGTCTTSEIFFTSPSRCAVADSCAISIDRRMEAVNYQEGVFPANYCKIRCLENHDQPRAAQLIPDEGRLRAWTALCYFLRGTTLLYAGQEAAASHTPSLFDRDTISWDTGTDLTDLMSIWSPPLKSRSFQGILLRVEGIPLSVSRRERTVG